MNKSELALKLFSPNEKGVSRWVCKDECVGEFDILMPVHGNNWYRNKPIGGTHIWEKKIVDGKTYWRLNGFREKEVKRPIRKDIRKQLLTVNAVCSHTGYSSTANDHLIVDHRNGRYDDDVALDLSTQSIDDFQILSNRANLFKRSICNNVCKKTGQRFDAKTLGYSKSVSCGNLEYEGTCVGCYWFGPKEFRESL